MAVSHLADTDQTAPLLPAPVAAQDGFSFRNLLTRAFFHKRIILLTALIPIIVGIAAAWKAKPEYTASSLLMVLVNREYSASQNVTDSGPAVLSIEGLKSVESEVQIIESADVILATIEDVGSDRIFPKDEWSLGDLLASLRASGNPTDEAVERFRRRLRTNVLSGSNVVQVEFTNPNRQVAIEVTDRLVANYMTRRRQIFSNPSSAILQSEVDRFGADLRRLDQRVQEAKTRSNVIDISQDALLATNQVDSIVQRRRQVQERQAGVVAQLAEAERQLAELPPTVFDFAQRSDEAGTGEDRNILTRLLVDRDRIASQYAPGSAQLREVDRKIATVRQALQAPNQTAAKTDREVRNPAIGYMNNMILSLRVERDSLARQIDELDRQQPVAQTRVDALRVAETELVELNRERDSLSESYREYLRRAVAASIEETAAQVRATNVRTVQSADTAVVRRSMRLAFIAAGLFGAILFGAAAGVAAAVMRSTFINPDEAERALRLPVLAEFGRGARAFEEGSGGEAISALASRLVDTRIDGRPLFALQFVSPDENEAVGRFATALARELSTAQGLRTLLVAARSDESIGSPASYGGLLVRRTEAPRMWRAEPAEDAPLFSPRRSIHDAREALAELHANFDMVLIVTEAPDAIRTAQRLAPLVDANVIMIRAERTRAPVAQHLRDVVLNAGGGLLGFIFTHRKYYIPRWIYRRV